MLDVEKLNQIKKTLVDELEDFSRDDVEYSYDKSGVLNEESRICQEERAERYNNYETSIKNMNELINEVVLRNLDRSF